MGLARRHAPPETLRAALANRVRRQPSPNAALYAEDELDVWTGDFAAVLARQPERDKALAGVDDLDRLADATYVTTTALHEVGRDAEAARVAAAFLGRRPLLTTIAQMGNGGVDVSPLIAAVARQVGTLPRAAWVGMRDAWYRVWAKPGNANDASSAWGMLYAGSALTRDDAQEALASMPDAFPTSVYNFPKMAYGHMYVLLERWDDAIANLASAVETCDVLVETPLLVRAHAELAQAYTAKGDKAHACEQLRWVIGTWGDAKPRSVTAEAARKSAGGLGCGNQ
jgi:serine/threonine-protein kinase